MPVVTGFAAPERLLETFLGALDAADADGLERFFCPDATMYFPFVGTLDLIEGREAVVARFRRMLADLGARGAQRPLIGFTVRSCATRDLGAECCLLLVRLEFQGQVGRRSVVCRREEDGWRILHLHASNFTPRVEASPQ